MYQSTTALLAVKFPRAWDVDAVVDGRCAVHPRRASENRRDLAQTLAKNVATRARTRVSSCGGSVKLAATPPSPVPPFIHRPIQASNFVKPSCGRRAAQEKPSFAGTDLDSLSRDRGTSFLVAISGRRRRSASLTPPLPPTVDCPSLVIYIPTGLSLRRFSLPSFSPSSHSLS